MSEIARRLLRESEDLGIRGEYIPAIAPMTIHVGLADLPAIRATFAKALAETVSPLSMRAIGPFLQALRSDAEIDRLHWELFGWRKVASGEARNSQPSKAPREISCEFGRWRLHRISKALNY
jgi:hypothetical protein